MNGTPHMTGKLCASRLAMLAGLLIVAACGGDDPKMAVSDIVITTASTTEAATDTTIPDTTVATSTTAPTTTTPPTTTPDQQDGPARCGLTGSYEEVPCDEPHDAEFVGTVATPDDPDDVAAMAACGPLVEAYVERPMAVFGVDVGFAPTEGSASNSLDCWAQVSVHDALTASIREVGLADALGELVFITDLDAGMCFVLADPLQETVDLGSMIECDQPDAALLFGQFEADDGASPSEATIDGFYDRCRELADQGDFPSPDDADNWYVILPKTEDWEAHGRRSVLCIMEPSPELNTDPTGIVGPVCANYDADLQDYPIVPCDEPHSAEFAGSVTPPPGNLPDNADDATILLNQLCREPVETLTGRSLERFGSGVGFVSEDGLGEPMANDIRCYVSVSLDGAFTAAIGEVGYDEALAYEIVGDIDPGECFTLAGDSFSFAELTPCHVPDALTAIGSFFTDDPPGSPYPGEDALRAVRTERCTEILSDSGLLEAALALPTGVGRVDPATLSGVIPSELNWLSFDLREITCDAALTVE